MKPLNAALPRLAQPELADSGVQPLLLAKATPLTSLVSDGTEYSDTLYGGGGADSLSGLGGSDLLYGGGRG